MSLINTNNLTTQQLEDAIKESRRLVGYILMEWFEEPTMAPDHVLEQVAKHMADVREMEVVLSQRTGKRVRTTRRR